MTPKEKRDRLFRVSRPHFRPAVLVDENGYGYDMGLLWAAYKAGSFPLAGNLSEAEFAEHIVALGTTLTGAMMVEDDCAKYSSGRGPVALISIRSDGWRVEPHVDYFNWAGKRTPLRVSVAFFQMARYSKDVGSCVVSSLKDTENLFNHVCEYGVLHPVGRVPKGSVRGDVYMFSVTGKKEIRSQEALAA